MKRLRIANGRIIDPANHTDEIGDICVSNRKIVSVADLAPDFKEDLKIDLKKKKEVSSKEENK